MSDIIESGGADVPTPIIEADCSVINLIDPTPSVNVTSYRDGAIIRELKSRTP